MQIIVPSPPERGAKVSSLIVYGGLIWPGPSEPLMKDGAVLCKDGRIVQLGSYKVLREAHPDAREVGDLNALVMPGLINAHHHGRSLDAVNLGTLDDWLEPWLLGRMLEPTVDPYLDTLCAAANLLARGVTTVVHYQATRNAAMAIDEAEARLQAWNDAGIRVAFGLDLRQIRQLVYENEQDFLMKLSENNISVEANVASRYVMSGEEYLRIFEEIKQKNFPRDQTRSFLAPSGTQWLTDETLTLVAEYARANEVRIHLHTLESPYQKQAGHFLYGRSIVEHLGQKGVLSPNTSLVHAVWLTERDISLIADTQTNVVHNPGANLRLRSGIAPIPQLLAAKVNVALGTDGFTLGDDDLLAEIRLAYHLHRLPGVVAPPISLEQVLNMVTEGAAQVTPFAGEIGLLRPGFFADFTIIDLEKLAHPFAHPSLDPLHLLVSRGSGKHVIATIVNGEIVAKNGRATLVDSNAITEQLVASMEVRTELPSSQLTKAAIEHYKQWWNPNEEVSYWPRNGM